MGITLKGRPIHRLARQQGCVHWISSSLGREGRTRTGHLIQSQLNQTSLPPTSNSTFSLITQSDDCNVVIHLGKLTLSCSEVKLELVMEISFPLPVSGLDMPWFIIPVTEMWLWCGVISWWTYGKSIFILKKKTECFLLHDLAMFG